MDKPKIIKKIPPKNVKVVEEDPGKPCKLCGHKVRPKKDVDEKKPSKCRICGELYTVKASHVKSDRHVTIKYLLDKVMTADDNKLAQLKQSV